MKLQVFHKGSWRDVVEFDADRSTEVEDAAASLARATGFWGLCLVDDDGRTRHLNGNGVFRALREEQA